MNKFAVFDIDGTLIRWQLYHVVVDKLAKVNFLGSESSNILKEARMKWKQRENHNSFRNYENILVQTYENALQSIPTKKFDKLVSEVISQYQSQTYVYTRNMIIELKKQEYKLFIISGSHKELVEQIGKIYGFDDWIGTTYERLGNTFSGKVSKAAFDKDKSLQKLIKRNKVKLDGSIGIGDTGSDIPMLKMVEKPIAFNPDVTLYQEAKKFGWNIVIERKNVIYELRKEDGRYQLLA